MTTTTTTTTMPSRILCIILCSLTITMVVVVQGEPIPATRQLPPRRRVCVIGAGAGGLESAKQVAERFKEFEPPVVFEKNSDVGGLWIYDDSEDYDKHGLPVHSSVYENLRINLPRDLMAFPDFQHFMGNRSCVSHVKVYEYLRNFTDYFKLRQYIQFDTLVEKIKPIAADDEDVAANLHDDDWRFTTAATKWNVQTRNLNTNETGETICDSVMIANGHYAKPYIPLIPGMEGFTGQVMHSHTYRRPEKFAGQTVVLLGAASSGRDLAFELAPYAETIYLSHNKKKLGAGVALPSNIIQVPGVVAVANGSELILKDGSRINADTFIYCTGYSYDFPFLDAASSGITTEDKRVYPLYKHMVNVEHPTMAFIGLPAGALTFTIFTVQAQYYLALLQGKAKLPTREQMLREAELSTAAGKSKNLAHFLGPAQWAYFSDLARYGGFDDLPQFYRPGFTLWDAYRNVYLTTFKDSDLHIYTDNYVEIVEPSGRRIVLG